MRHCWPAPPRSGPSSQQHKALAPSPAGEVFFAAYTVAHAHPDGSGHWQLFEGNSNPAALDYKLAITGEELDALTGSGAAEAAAAFGASLLPRLGIEEAATEARFILRRRAATAAVAIQDAAATLQSEPGRDPHTYFHTFS